MSGNSEQVLRWQAKKIAQGLCSSCGIEPLANKRYCAKCVEARRRRQYGLVAEGLCQYCGTEPLVSEIYCRGCLDKKIAAAHGLTPEQYRSWMDEGCAACGRSDCRLDVDHDHACCPSKRNCPNCVRGVLCSLHNRAIGILERKDALTMIQYLLRVGSSAPLVEHLRELESRPALSSQELCWLIDGLMVLMKDVENNPRNDGSELPAMQQLLSRLMGVS